MSDDAFALDLDRLAGAAAALRDRRPALHQLSDRAGVERGLRTRRLPRRPRRQGRRGERRAVALRARAVLREPLPLLRVQQADHARSRPRRAVPRHDRARDRRGARARCGCRAARPSSTGAAARPPGSRPRRSAGCTRRSSTPSRSPPAPRSRSRWIPRVTTARARRDARRVRLQPHLAWACRTSSRACSRRSTAIQPADVTARLVEWSRDAGFESVNFDLIYGLPYQTPESFSSDARHAVRDRPRPHRALLVRARDLARQAAARLREARTCPIPPPSSRSCSRRSGASSREGYRFIGLDHFARPDDELAKALADRTLRRNFMGHTTQAGVDLMGFGPSAISELRRSYAQNHRDVADWEQRGRTSDGLATMRGHRLSRDDLERRWVITRILCHGEVRAREFEETFGRGFREAFARELLELEVPRAGRPPRDRRGRQPARDARRPPAASGTSPCPSTRISRASARRASACSARPYERRRRRGSTRSWWAPASPGSRRRSKSSRPAGRSPSSTPPIGPAA